MNATVVKEAKVKRLEAAGKRGRNCAPRLSQLHDITSLQVILHDLK